jgi:hypothetical protein
LQAAKTSQESFEGYRRERLRFYTGGATATCEEPIGRLCYWNNNDDVPPPPERPDIASERRNLIDVLAAATKGNPADDWAIGQYVRYLTEDGQRAAALAAARSCGGTRWWCSLLEGFALHIGNEHLAASAAFDAALAAMPADQRCKWTDLSQWLDQATLATYKPLSCAAREAANARILWLAKPLFILPGNDLRDELIARHTMSRMQSQAKLPYDQTWGDDFEETEVRYGWPVAWSVQNGGVADPRIPSVIGHEPTPSYDFMPTARAVEAPATAAASEWNLKRERAKMRYSPRYASGFGVLSHQLARFRRGDSTLVVGAYDAAADRDFGRGKVRAGLLLAEGPQRIIATRVSDDGAMRGALSATVAREPMLMGLEVIDTARHRAARARYAIEPLSADASVSDVLFLVPGATPDRISLESLLPQAFGSQQIPAGGTVRLYWESYRPTSPTSPQTVSIKATRLNMSLRQRITGGLRLTTRPTPVSIRFTDNGRPDAGVGRVVSLSFPQVPAGQYRLELTVSGGGLPPATSAQTVTVTSRDDR